MSVVATSLVEGERASLLYPDEAHVPRGPVAAPDHFVDLNLDQLFASLTRGRVEFRLEDYFHSPLVSVDAVAYRHEVLNDLENDALLRGVREFADGMSSVRSELGSAGKMRDRLQQQYWWLRSALSYIDAVRALVATLSTAAPRSRALRSAAGYLEGYVRSSRFTQLAAEADAVRSGLDAIRYRLHLTGRSLRVSPDAGEDDYAQDVADTFERFRQGQVESHLARLPDYAEMNHVEAAIAERVARLFPEAFAALEDFCARHADFLAPFVERLDRELQFYLAFLEFSGRLRRAGLAWCYPEVAETNEGYRLADAFDPTLASTLVDTETPVVCNDVQLSGQERLLVVTGPNNGGKTTFARMIGQVAYLASLGLSVPGTHARLPLPDRILTHFEHGENLQDRVGALEDDLVRARALLEAATEHSLVIINEIFTSTSLDDAVLLSTAVLRRTLDRQCLCVCVTFIDELATLSEHSVSMVAQADPRDPAKRTFVVLRQPASGTAYAEALAQKYGLTYSALTRRLSR